MARKWSLRFILRQDGGLPRIAKALSLGSRRRLLGNGRVARHGADAAAEPETGPQRVFISVITDEDPKPAIDAKALKFFGLRSKDLDQLKFEDKLQTLSALENFEQVVGPMPRAWALLLRLAILI